MKTLGNTFKKLIFASLASASLTAAASSTLYPDCDQPQRDTYVLRFHGEAIYAPAYRKVLPLKKMLIENCQANLAELRNISRVVVGAESFSPRSAAWLDGTNINTRPYFFRAGGARERARFDLRRGEAHGRLRVMLQGDLNLYAIRVKLNSFGRPQPAPGPGRGPHQRDYTLTCSSIRNSTHFCPVNGLVRGFMMQQHSFSPCIEGHSFWFTRDGIKVANGCRANFHVTVRR